MAAIEVKFTEEDLRRWVEIGFKIKKSSGRPVRDLVFDKVAMSTLHFFFKHELLPPYENAILAELQSYLKAGPKSGSHGF